MSASAVPAEEREAAARAALAPRLASQNINPISFLATDYLNHFNEFVMVLDLVASCPEMLDELTAWSPKSYPRHFEESGFAARDLAVAAYQLAPTAYRVPFDASIAKLDSIAEACLAAIVPLLEGGDAPAELATLAAAFSSRMRAEIDKANALINAVAAVAHQEDVDALLGSR